MTGDVSSCLQYWNLLYKMDQTTEISTAGL